ncbi:MAG: hypothetical protein F6J93_02740 [Oscillatoria sp. SIO1A7]|nr:hypothetical protein [Oscillatoria sp. SIO1A7]
MISIGEAIRGIFIYRGELLGASLSQLSPQPDRARLTSSQFCQFLREDKQFCFSLNSLTIEAIALAD